MVTVKTDPGGVGSPSSLPLNRRSFFSVRRKSEMDFENKADGYTDQVSCPECGAKNAAFICGTQTPEGIVVLVYLKCLGCGYEFKEMV